MGHRLIIVGKKGKDLLLEISQRAKVPTFEECSHQNTEPDLDLVHPGGVFGGVREDNFVRWIMEKSGSRGHRLEDATFAFASQCFLLDAFPFGNPAHQRLGLMSIEFIDQDVPFACRRITGDQALKMSKAVLLIASGSPRGLNHLSSDHIEIEKPGKRPMPDILEFAPKHMACSHR